jgi:Fic family protein
MTLAETLRKVEELSRQLERLRPISPEKEKRIMDKFRLDWNYNSNHLEGNQLSYGETKALLLHGITAQGKPLRDHIQMEGHNETLKYLEEILKQHRPLTENFVRELHQMILKEPYEVDAITPDGRPTKKLVQVGQYKSSPNHVQTTTGEIFRFATPEETPAKMTDLVDWTRGELEKSDVSPLLLASEFHYRFIRIHPFDDGNGRLARILMNFLLMMKRYPPIIIKSEKKDEYFAALRQADAGNAEVFFDYLGQQLIKSFDIMIRGAKGEPIEELDDVDKELALLKEQLKKEEDVRFARSNEVILTLWQNCLYDLFDSLHVKLSQYDELFLLKREYCYVNRGLEGNSQHYNSYINTYFDRLIQLTKRIQEQANQQQQKAIQDELNSIQTHSVSYQSFWEAFKKTKTNPFDMNCWMHVYFDKIKYRIVPDADCNNAFPEIQKLYHEILTKEEIDGIVNLVSKSILGAIKSHLDLHPKD